MKGNLDRTLRTKSKKACLRCKRRKTKCSGETKCRTCLLANEECIYSDNDKKITITALKLKGLKDRIKNLENQLDSYRDAGRLARVATDLNISKQSKQILNSSQLEAGSSDVVITKLANIKNININENRGLNDNRNNYDRIEQINMMKDIRLSQAEELVDTVHFYLASVNIPFEREYIFEKMRSFYHDEQWVFPKDRYWKLLIYILLALGEHYLGKKDTSSKTVLFDKCSNLFSSGISLIFPLMGPWNEITIMALILATYYFRSINEDNNAALYSKLAIDISVQLNLHQSSENICYTKEIQEQRKRIFWSAFTTNRFLSAKLGHSMILAHSQINLSYPLMISFFQGVQTPIKFPDSEDMKFYIDLAKIAEDIVNFIYKRNNYTNEELLGAIVVIIEKLIDWNRCLPLNFQLRLNDRIVSDGRDKRLMCSIHLNYCYQIHLSTVAVLYQLVYEKLNSQNNCPFNIKQLPSNITTMLTICINAAHLTTNIMNKCFEETTIAIFGVVDVDYLYSACLTFSLAAFLDFQEELQGSLNLCLNILHFLSEKGNANATSKFLKITLFINGLTKKSEELNNSNLNSSHWITKNSTSIPMRDELITDSCLPYNSKIIDPSLSSSNIFDCSFLPTLVDNASNGKFNLMGEEEEFWGNAYSNVNIWRNDLGLEIDKIIERKESP